MMLAFAAISLSVNAQDLKTFDGKLFTCQYPAAYEAQEQWLDEAFNAKDKMDLGFDVTIGDDPLTAQQLKDWGEGMKGMIETSFGEPTGWKASQPVLKGLTLTIRAESEQEVYDEQKEEDVKVAQVKITFITVNAQKKTFSGSITFLKSEEAKYTALLDKMFASFKAK